VKNYHVESEFDFFGDVLHVETSHKTAEASIVVSTAHAMVKTTYSCDDSLADQIRRNPESQMFCGLTLGFADQ
jgi:hypothetical protein